MSGQFKRLLYGFLHGSIAACLIATCLHCICFAAVTDNRTSNTEQIKPIAVVSFSGYNALFANIQTLGKASGNPDLAVGIEAMLKFATRSQGLAGLDKSRPWGAAVYYPSNPGQWGFVFLPVSDLHKLLAVLEPIIGKPQNVGDGILKISGNEELDAGNNVDRKKIPLFIKPLGPWTVFSRSRENLALVPRDPGELLGDLPENYDLAFRIQVADMSENWRDRLLCAMQEQLQAGIERQLDEDKIENSLGDQLSRKIVETIRHESKDVDRITLGWKLDNLSEKTFVDLIVWARPGSEMQKQLSRWSECKTRFAGFHMAEASLSCGWVGRLTSSEAKAINRLLAFAHAKTLRNIEEQGHSTGERSAANAFVVELFDFLELGVDARSFDGAAAVLLGRDSATLLLAKHVHDPAKLEELTRQFAGILAAERPQLKEILSVQKDVERFEGVRLHTISVPIPDSMEDRDKVVALVGQTLEVVLGVGKDSVYLAAGHEPLSALKRAIAASAEQRDRMVSPLRMSIGLRSLAEAMAQMSENTEQREKADALATILSRSNHQDHLVLTIKPVDDGLRLRLEAQSGIVKALGTIITMLPADLMNK